MNKEDKFGNTAVTILCSKDIHKDNKIKMNCIKIFIENGSNIFLRNKRTRWNCIFWLSYYGDWDSLNYLLNFSKIINIEMLLFEPDYQGYYPIDFAGKNVKI